MSAMHPDPRVAAAKRIVKNDDALVRDIEGGGAEILSMHRGRVSRHLVDPGGTTILLTTGDRSRQWLVGCAAVVLGCAMVLGSFISLETLGDDYGLLTFLAGLGVVCAGAALVQRATQGALRSVAEGTGWASTIALSLRGDEPPIGVMSLSQLAALGELALANGRAAAVRNADDGTFDVVTARGGTVSRYVVGRDAAQLVDSRPGWPYPSVKSAARKHYGGERRDWTLVDFNPDE